MPPCDCDFQNSTEKAVVGKVQSNGYSTVTFISCFGHKKRLGWNIGIIFSPRSVNVQEITGKFQMQFNPMLNGLFNCICDDATSGTATVCPDLVKDFGHCLHL